MPDKTKLFRYGQLGYHWLAEAGHAIGFVLLLLIRINWGWLFFIDGKGKLLGHQDVAQYFASLQLPFPEMTAWFVGGVECIGGLLLLIGLASRPVGLALTVNMIVAYLSVPDERNKVLNFFQNQDDFLHADPFFFLLAALLAFSFGGGPLSADALIGKWLKKKGLLATKVAE